ncbi:MAG: hypothetical protein QHH75_04580 [Bacillota bacterium]|jgi:hypothetical protein|nr:hypothetical protein [Bacillota bacterium]
MGFFDILFGRSRPRQARLDPLFALTTAAITFETELGWVPADRAGLVLRPVATRDFRATEKELRDLLELASRETKTGVEVREDEYRYRWLIFRDPDWDDLVALVHLAGQTLTEKGYGTQLLAAVFPFKQEEDPKGKKDALYLIFNYKRGLFYPFLPRGDAAARERDTAEETRVQALLEKELPWEKDFSYWYPLWGCPI